MIVIDFAFAVSAWNWLQEDVTCSAPPIIAASAVIQTLVILIAAGIMTACCFFLSRRNPLRHLAAWKLAQKPAVKFVRVDYAAVSDGSHRCWFQSTLGFRVEGDSIYLRSWLVPFVPTCWCIPRRHIRFVSQGEYSFEIDTGTVVLRADFGDEFAAAFGQK